VWEAEEESERTSEWAREREVEVENEGGGDEDDVGVDVDGEGEWVRRWESGYHVICVYTRERAMCFKKWNVHEWARKDRDRCERGTEEGKKEFGMRSTTYEKEGRIERLKDEQWHHWWHVRKRKKAKWSKKLRITSEAMRREKEHVHVHTHTHTHTHPGSSLQSAEVRQVASQLEVVQFPHPFERSVGWQVQHSRLNPPHTPVPLYRQAPSWWPQKEPQEGRGL
jgi:hypothetical protein